MEIQLDRHGSMDPIDSHGGLTDGGWQQKAAAASTCRASPRRSPACVCPNSRAGLPDLHSGFSLAHAPQRVRLGEVPAIPGRGPFHRSEARYPWLRCVDLPLYEWYQSWGQVTWLTEAGFRGVTVSPLDPPMPHWLAEAH